MIASILKGLVLPLFLIFLLCSCIHSQEKSSLLDAKTDTKIGLLEEESQNISQNREKSIATLRESEAKRRQFDLQRSVTEQL